MSTLALSIVVYGPGTDANHRSHWAIALHRSHLQTGTILHVWPIDLSRLIYQLEIRNNTALDSQSPEGKRDDEPSRKLCESRRMIMLSVERGRKQRSQLNAEQNPIRGAQRLRV